MLTQHLLEGEDALVAEVHLRILRVLQLDREEHRLLSLGPLDAWELPVQAKRSNMLYIRAFQEHKRVSLTDLLTQPFLKVH